MQNMLGNCYDRAVIKQKLSYGGMENIAVFYNMNRGIIQFSIRIVYNSSTVGLKNIS